MGEVAAAGAGRRRVVQAQVVIHVTEGGDDVQVWGARREGGVGPVLAVHTTRWVLVVRVVAATWWYTNTYTLEGLSMCV